MPGTTQRYYFSIDDLAKARGETAELAFTGASPEAFAGALQAALRESTLWQRWRAMQADPDAIDASLGANDPQATVKAGQSDLRTDIEVTTKLPHAILKHRLTLLAGRSWTLRDVRAA